MATAAEINLQPGMRGIFISGSPRESDEVVPGSKFALPGATLTATLVEAISGDVTGGTENIRTRVVSSTNPEIKSGDIFLVDPAANNFVGLTTRDAVRTDLVYAGVKAKVEPTTRPGFEKITLQRDGPPLIHLNPKHRKEAGVSTQEPSILFRTSPRHLARPTGRHTI